MKLMKRIDWAGLQESPAFLFHSSRIIAIAAIGATSLNLPIIPRAILLSLASTVGIHSSALYKDERKKFDEYSEGTAKLIEDNLAIYTQQFEELLNQAEDSHKDTLQKALEAASKVQKERDTALSGYKALEVKIARLQSDLQEAKDRINGSELEIKLKKDQLDSGLSQLASEKAWHEDRMKADKAALQAENERFEADVLQAMQTYEAQISELKARLAALEDPRMSRGEREADSIANATIEFFWREAIILDFVSAFETPDSFMIRIAPRDQSTTTKDLEKFAEALQRHLRAPRSPQFSVSHGELLITISQRPERKNSPIAEPAEDWFRSVLLNSKDGNLRPNHARFVGESESGKSALVANALGVVQSICPDVEFWLGDPISDSGESEWQIPAKFRNSEECLEGIKELELIFETRKNDPDFNKNSIILFLDEIDDLAAEFGDELINRIKKIWKQGRHFGCFVWVSGQSPYCKTLKMGLSDFRNCINFYLSATIAKGLKDLNLTPEREAYWLKQSELRQDAGSRFITLVSPKRQPCFIADLPLPGTFEQPATLDSKGLASFERDSSELSEQAKKAIAELAAQNSSIPQILEFVFNLKPSKSKRYQDLKGLVSNYLATLPNPNPC